MRKPTKPVSPKASAPIPSGEAVRARPAAVAYRMYSQKALLRFDLEGQIETNRQQRAGLSLIELSGDSTVTEHVRDVLLQERAH